MLPFTPDAKEAVKGAYDPLPEGIYELQCTSCMEKNGQNNSSYLNSEFLVTDGQYSGRKIFARITLRNNNEKAVAIGTRQMHAWALMAKLAKVEHAADFTGSSIKAKIKVRKQPARTDATTGKTYDERLENEIDFSWKPGTEVQTTNKGVDKAPDKW